MQDTNVSTVRKALTINLDDSKFGAFAEIGAGQEVARYFFQAGRASSTVAKSMSAYDKIFSDAIYGKGSRFVSRERLEKMLKHEYSLLIDRLQNIRGDSTCFFAFADTVATSSHEDNATGCHGWMGVTFQIRPNGPLNTIILHVRMLDRMRLQQTSALGVLGVNLIFSALYMTDLVTEFIDSLTENLGDDRVDIDYLQFNGPDLEHVDNRRVGIELVSRNLTKSVLFAPKGQVIQAYDALYKHPVIVHRGTFRPITQISDDIMKAGYEQMKGSLGKGTVEPFRILEMTMQSASKVDSEDIQDYLHRVDTIAPLGHHVLISKFSLYSDLKEYLRRCTDQKIVILAGASILEKLYNEQFYNHLQGGILQAFGTLFDNDTQLFIYPFKSDKICQTAHSFHPDSHLDYLHKHLLENTKIVDLSNCDDLDTTIDSAKVRELLEQNNDQWKKFVPKKSAEVIIKNHYFQKK
ncbi:MAG: hypothetical protein KDD61_08450 [Bdellovibrionales bacterium]|nr:hypothetical protein [Bdellovibrionales bacterium]